MADIIDFVVKGTDKASPELEKTAKAIAGLRAEIRASNAETAAAGQGPKAYGTATAGARVEAAKFYDLLRQSRGATDTASGGFDGVNRAAKDLAQGGFRDILSEVPLIGGALSKLAGTLGGFPLLLGGIAGAGLGVLKFLQGWNDETTKALASTTALATKIGTDFRDALLEVQRIRADAAGDPGGAIEASYARDLQRIEAAKQARIDAAREELNQLDLFGRKRTELSQGALNEIAAAEGEAATKRLVINAQYTADKGKLEQQQAADAKAARDKEVQDAAEAAEQQKQLLQDLTTKSLDIFRKLGDGFKDASDALGLAQFVDQSKQAIETLRQAYEKGVISEEAMTKGQQALTEKMQEAITLGYDPAAQAADATAKSVENAGNAAQESVPKWEAMAGALLDVARAQAAVRSAQATPAQPAETQRGSFTIGTAYDDDNKLSIIRSIRDLDQRYAISRTLGQAGAALSARPLSTTPIGGGYDDYSHGSTSGRSPDAPARYDPATGAYTNLPSFDKGGTVPGPLGAPRLILAHGGEEVTPAGRRGGGGLTLHVTINQSGRVIREERDWRDMVEELGQELDARMARRGG